MTRPEKAYLSVIESIHGLKPAPFSTWEIAKATGLHRNVTRRILNRLCLMRYILKAPAGFAHRVWRVSRKWPTEGCQEVVEDYELLRLVSR